MYREPASFLEPVNRDADDERNDAGPVDDGRQHDGNRRSGEVPIEPGCGDGGDRKCRLHVNLQYRLGDEERVARPPGETFKTARKGRRKASLLQPPAL
jgi:hypothetical protein